ncbi:MAG: restriction endonuclease subunit S [Methanomicrobium sp.]|nr:restriction endonuclease subunit S [Methanomicrobium sp.]
MSKLEELMKMLCPNGVNYLFLCDVATIRNGRDYKGFQTGDVPVYGSGGVMTYIDTAIYNKPSVLIPRKGSLNNLFYVDEPFWNVDTIFYTEINEGKIIPKYLYYCLKREHLEEYNTAGGVPSLTQTILNKVLIPVPPLEVQRKIVRILDIFTDQTEKLKAELALELIARKKQYEYYRDQLLSFGKPRVEHQPLGKVATVLRGKRLTKSELQDGAPYPVYHGGLDPLGYYIESNRKANTVMVINVGASAGTVGYSAKEFWSSDGCYCIYPNEQLMDRFLYYYLSCREKAIKGKVRYAGIPTLDAQVLEKIDVAIPSIDTQKRIVSVLDNFDVICSDLNIGLLAEIEARKLQYEYYRDLLLSFGSQFVHVERERERSRARVSRIDEIKLLQYVFGYVRVTIADIAETNIGLATSVTKYKAEDGVVLLHNSDIQPNRIVLKSVEFITEDFAKKNCKKILHKGDIITVHTGDVGTSAVITEEYDGSIGFTTITTRIKDQTIVGAQFLCNYLNSHACKEQIASMTISDRNNLNQSSFEKIVLVIPSIAEQERANAMLAKMDALCSDISEGLLAEIEARQKQYEFYRDKLLSF